MIVCSIDRHYGPFKALPCPQCSSLALAILETGMSENATELVRPWWRDSRLGKLNLIILGIISVQITAGYDQVVVGSFQSMLDWCASAAPKICRSVLTLTQAQHYGKP